MRRTLGTALAMLAFAVPVRAESFQITSGALVWSSTNPDTVTLAGAGFSFDGTAASGLFEPALLCAAPDCVAGTTIDLFARWVGSDLPGTATVHGTTFSNVGSAASDTSLDANWTGTLDIPNGFGGGLLSAPFAFTGRFLTGTGFIDLFGSGTAALSFSPYAQSPGAFALMSATYEFESAAAVPEPISAVLVGTGLAGLAALRRRRNMRR